MGAAVGAGQLERKPVVSSVQTGFIPKLLEF
jgi:hypothetical protein